MYRSLISRRILMVEDQPGFRLILAMALHALDWEVIPAINGADALTLFEDYDREFDVVITDYEMPTMDGLELVQSLRAIGFQDRIIVMSEKVSPEEWKVFQQSDINDFLQKPFELERLAAILNENSPMVRSR